MTVEQVWSEIRQEGRLENGWHVRRVHAGAPCEILVGIRQPGGIPGLLLEVPLSSAPSGLFPQRSKGFVIESGLALPSTSPRLRVALSLADRAYMQVFSILCEDTAQEAASGSNPRDAIRRWLNRVHVWQDFMERHGVEGLSEQAASGLFGEVLVMRDLLAPTLGPARTVQAWSGPQGEPNDFFLPGSFIEVKTTSRQVPESLLISDMDQLDDTRGPILLAHVRVLPGGDGESLPQLISSFRSLLANQEGSHLQSFNSMLMDVGYLDAHSHLYPREYKLMGIDLYRITSDFPRIRRAELRPGVLSAKYEIDISTCSPYQVSKEMFEQIVRVRHGF